MSPEGPADQFAAGRPSFVGGITNQIGVIWEAKRSADTDSSVSIWGQFFDLSLQPLDTPFLVETTPPLGSDSIHAAASFTEDGHWVAVWVQAKDDPDDEDNVAYVRTALPGQAATVEFVNTTVPWSQYYPSLVSGVGGVWAVVWHNTAFDPPDQSIRFRLYNGGAATTGEVSVDSEQSPYSIDGIGLRGENGVDVLWSGSVDFLHWRLFASHAGATTLIGKQLSDEDGSARHPAAASLPKGRKIVAWREDGGSTSSGIRARIFDEAYEPASLAIVVWADPAPSQVRDKQPRVAASGSGNYSVVTWVLGDDRANVRDHDVVAQLLNAQGEPIRPLFYVSEAEKVVDQQSPQVRFLSETSFVIVWGSEPDPQRVSSRVVGRLFAIASDDLCGDASGDGTLTAGDALTALRSAVGIAACPICLCDVDGSGAVSSIDALKVLRSAIGFPGSINCPQC